MRMPYVAPLLFLLSVAAAAGADPPRAAAPIIALNDAPANTWVKIAQSPTGWRDQPVLVYAPSIKRLVMAAGYQAYGGVVPRHYDTEEFDPVTAQWFNAYPADVAAGRPESGPVGDAYSKDRAMHGYNGGDIFYKDGENFRVGAGGQWLETRGYHEWCYVPANGKIYAYLHDHTLCYDPTKRTWQNLGTKPRTSNRIWGAMCYNPVNKEILHAVGAGGSDELATWAYAIETNQWRKLEFGDAPGARVASRAKALVWQAKTLLGSVCNRFAVSETQEEAAADLKAKAAELETAAGVLVTEIEGKATPKNAVAAAAGHFGTARQMLQECGDKLAGPITPEAIAAVRAARVKFEQAADALAIEPPGRARSQAVYDPEHQQIVLFGGDGLDRVLSDTWLYDCKTRTWHQWFPKLCPKPRAGHVLAWLPRAKKIVLAGGYSRDWLPQEVWTYDVAANEWTLLLTVPLAPEDYGRKKFSQNCPRVTARGLQAGAVLDDDVLVCLSPADPGLTTWACRVDPGKPTEIPEGQAGTPGDYTFHRIDPADWEQIAEPDAVRNKDFYALLPANEWTALKFPKYAPGATNRWGTTTYDVDRHQLLFWGGGHATSQENDVAHFSLFGGCWTIGYHPDDPIERVYATQPTPVSFCDRVHVPVHAYKAYCYDPSARLMLYFDRAYDPAIREWRPNAYVGLEHRGPMHSHMEPTPAGTVTFSDKGLFRFDAKAGRWVKLPWTGPQPNGIWCDGHSLLYDSKRDCLWLSNEKDIYRYDMATGKTEKSTPAKPKALGQFLFWGEEVYLPEADLVLLMNLFKRSDGSLSNVAWDPSSGKFYWVELKVVEDGKSVAFKSPPFSWSDALQYDPALKLVVLNNSSARKVWILRLDRRIVRMEEM